MGRFEGSAFADSLHFTSPSPLTTCTNILKRHITLCSSQTLFLRSVYDEHTACFFWRYSIPLCLRSVFTPGFKKNTRENIGCFDLRKMGAAFGFLTNGRSNSGVLLFLQNLIASVFIPRSLIWDHTAAATIKSLWVSWRREENTTYRASVLMGVSGRVFVTHCYCTAGRPGLFASTHQEGVFLVSGSGFATIGKYPGQEKRISNHRAIGFFARGRAGKLSGDGAFLRPQHGEGVGSQCHRSFQRCK